MEGEIDDILPIGSLDGTESGYVGNETQRDEPKTVVESDIYREYASLCEPHESMLFSRVKPSFDRTATDKHGKVPTIVVKSDYEKDLNLPISFGGYVRPSFTRIAANQCVQVGDMILRQSVPSRRTLIMRPKDSKGAKDDDVEILEEEAVCKSCFAKLNSNDNTFKTSCGCGSVLIHENCVECWCRVVFENKNTCDKCGEEVQKQPVVLINDSIHDKSESSKRSWFSSLKR